MSLSASDKNDIRDIFNEGFEALVLPQFEAMNGRMDGLEGRMDRLEGRMDGLEGRMASLEHELRDFKSEVRTKLATLEQKIDALEAKSTDRFENFEEDIRLIYILVDKLEHGTKQEMKFAEDMIIEHLPAIYKAVVLVAKKQHITLPKM